MHNEEKGKLFFCSTIYNSRRLFKNISINKGLFLCIMQYYAPNKKNDMEKSSRFIFKWEKQNQGNYV